MHSAALAIRLLCMKEFLRCNIKKKRGSDYNYSLHLLPPVLIMKNEQGTGVGRCHEPITTRGCKEASFTSDAGG